MGEGDVRLDGAEPAPPGPGDAGTAELDRLRAEVAELRGRLETGARRRHRGRAVRRAAAATLVALAGFGLVCSVIGLWGARTTLDTERWVSTVDSLPSHPEVTNAMAAYLTDEVFRALDVQRRLAEALPPKAAFLAGPVTGAVHDYTKGIVTRFMASEQFRTLWNDANRFAHTQILAILESRSQSVSIEGSTITLNLLPVVNNLLVAVEARLPTLFGKRLDLPALTSGAVPPGLRERVQTATGVLLPADFAQIKLYDRPLLGQLQEALLTFKRLIALLIAGTLLALALALWISPHRRRTVLQLGLWLSIAAVVLSSGLRAVRDQFLALVPEGMYRQGVSVAVYDIFGELRQWGSWILWSGIVVAALCHLAGPGRVPVALRGYAVTGTQATARWIRSIGTGTGAGTGRGARVRTWIGRHLDVLRVGGVAVAAVVALLFSSWTALLVVAAVLAGYEVLVTVIAHAGRDAPALLTGEVEDGAGPAGRGLPPADEIDADKVDAGEIRTGEIEAGEVPAGARRTGEIEPLPH
ncbi:hypothetical protein GCM10022419_115440 [Nonomuraea rosea]|uniref:Integral membrane protein n=1 Tax=Nonomuraea rosea TaxID=638574 RepID=A0ABP6ZK80_9ACTN